MTGLETILGGIVIALGSGVLGKVLLPGVSSKQCKETHTNLEKFLNLQYTSIEKRLERIEGKLDKQNGHESSIN